MSNPRRALILEIPTAQFIDDVLDAQDEEVDSVIDLIEESRCPVDPGGCVFLRGVCVFCGQDDSGKLRCSE